MSTRGLLEVDVTVARGALTANGPPLSLTAFVVASLGRALAAHPQVHAYRDRRGRLIQHGHVDIQTLVEIETSNGPFGLVHVVRDGIHRSCGTAQVSAVGMFAAGSGFAVAPAGLASVLVVDVGGIGRRLRVIENRIEIHRQRGSPPGSGGCSRRLPSSIRA